MEQPQRIVFDYAPPIGKTAAAPAPVTATAAASSQAAAPAAYSGSSRRSSGKTSRKRSGSGSSRRSSGGGSSRSSGGYASPVLVSAAAQAYSGSASAASVSMPYTPAMNYSPSRYSADITAAIRQRYNDYYYTPFVINRVKIEDIIPDFIVRQSNGALIRIAGYYDELSPEMQQLVLDALQKRAEEEVVGTVV